MLLRPAASRQGCDLGVTASSPFASPLLKRRERVGFLSFAVLSVVLERSLKCRSHVGPEGSQCIAQWRAHPR